MVFLNDDCLCHIFEYLPPNDKLSFSKVNSYYKHLISKTWNYTELEIGSYVGIYADTPLKYATKNEIYEMIELAGPHVRNLVLTTFELNYDTYILFNKHSYKTTDGRLDEDVIANKLCKFASKILTFKIVMDDWVDSYNKILLLCRQLKKLTLIGNEFIDCVDITFDFRQISDTIEELDLIEITTEDQEFLVEMLENMPKLQSLRLVDTEVLGKSALNAISKHAVQLKTLEMRMNHRYGYYAFSSYAAHDNISALTNLEELCLDQDIIPESKINSSDIVEIAKNCTRIKRLELRNLDISSEALSQALSFLLNLEMLSLNNLYNMDVFKIRNDLSNLKRLEVFSFKRRFMKSLPLAVRKMPVLLHLSVQSLNLMITKKIITTCSERNQKLVVNGFNHFYFFEQLIIERNDLKQYESDANYRPIFYVKISHAKNHFFKTLKQYVTKSLNDHAICIRKDRKYMKSYFDYN